MIIKPLVWKPGPVSKYTGQVNFDEAETPFGKYKAWYKDGELWGPTSGSCFLGKHGNLDAAKAAAQHHANASVEKMVF